MNICKILNDFFKSYLDFLKCVWGPLAANSVQEGEAKCWFFKVKKLFGIPFKYVMHQWDIHRIASEKPAIIFLNLSQLNISHVLYGIHVQGDT